MSTTEIGMDLGNETANANRPRRSSHYSVASVDKAEMPAQEGGDWYRYVVEDGHSTITGFRCGSRSEVVEYAQEFAEQLNTRNGPRAPSPWQRKRSISD
jgi:hypothetical protein